MSKQVLPRRLAVAQPGRGAVGGVAVAALAAVVFLVGFVVLDLAQGRGLQPGRAALAFVAAFLIGAPLAALVGALLATAPRPALLVAYGGTAELSALAFLLLTQRAIDPTIWLAGAAAVVAAAWLLRTRRDATYSMNPGGRVDPATLPHANGPATPHVYMTGPTPPNLPGI